MLLERELSDSAVEVGLNGSKKVATRLNIESDGQVAGRHDPVSNISPWCEVARCRVRAITRNIVQISKD